MDLFRQIEKHAKRQPGSLAFISPRGRIDYEHLDRVTKNISGNAKARGLTPGQIVHVHCQNPDLEVLMLLGLLRSGLTVAMAAGSDIYTEHGVVIDALISDAAPEADRPFTAKSRIQLSQDWAQPPRSALNGNAADDRYALLVASSGTTGARKLFHVSRKNIDYRINSKINHVFYQNDPRHFSPIGLRSTGYLADMFVVLCCGGSTILPENATARGALDSIEMYRPTYVSLAPALLVGMIKALSDKPRRLRKIDYLRLAGAYCNIATREAALDLIADNIITTYGATEISRVAFADHSEIAETEGSVGKIIDGVSVEALDDDRQPLPMGAEGEIRIRPPESAGLSLFRDGRLIPSLQDGWFYSGDIGRVTEAGELVISGRKSNVINLGGNKIDPERAEALLNRLPGVSDVAIGPVRGANGFDEICALIVTDGEMTLETVRAHLRHHKARFDIKSIKLVPEIPRNENGKIDRPAVTAEASRSASP